MAPLSQGEADAPLEGPTVTVLDRFLRYVAYDTQSRSSPPLAAEVPRGRGRPETAGTGDEESYDPVVLRKVGNWQRRNPLEGRGEHRDVPIGGYMATLRGRGPCPQN